MIRFFQGKLAGLGRRKVPGLVRWEGIVALQPGGEPDSMPGGARVTVRKMQKENRLKELSDLRLVLTLAVSTSVKWDNSSIYVCGELLGETPVKDEGEREREETQSL